MTDQKMREFRQQLMKLQGEFRAELSSMEDEVLHETDVRAAENLSDVAVEDRAERGFDNSSEDLALNLTENAAERFREIGAAIGRIDGGTFGHCTDCGGEISLGRLQSAPYVPQCIECAREAQRGGVVSMGNL